MVTQKDISAACGVSISAVSKALADYPDISEDTKRRIRDTAEKMGYYAKKNELTVKREHTYIVGLLITEETEREGCQTVIRELRKALVRKGYDLVLLSPEGEKGSRGGKAERPGYLPRARLYRMEGIFLFSGIQERDMYYREDFRDLRQLILGEIPVVAVGSFFASCRCVLPSCEKGIRKLVSEIYRRGHRRIAFVYKERMQEYGQCYKSICTSLAENRLEVPGKYLRDVKSGTFREAFAQTMDLLQGSRWIRPSCIVFTDDTLLEGGTAAVRRCGLRIPEDICLAAIRISEEVKYRDYPVVSWRISPSKIAEAAVEQLLYGMEGDEHGKDRVVMVDGVLLDEEIEEIEEAAQIYEYRNVYQMGMSHI